MTDRRVVVTGLGAITPHGCDLKQIFQALFSGASAVGTVNVGSPDRPTAVVGASVRDDLLSSLTRAQRSSSDRLGHLAIVAANAAIEDSRLNIALENTTRVGVAVGTSLGGVQSQGAAYEEILVRGRERLSPFTLVRVMYNAPAAQICLQHGIRGPSLTYSTTCSSSAVSLGEALKQIRHGYADVMIAGGAEAPFSFVSMKAWDALQVLAPADPQNVAATCKPFARNRNGTVLGEGAAFVILEELQHAVSRGAPIYGEFAGYGHTTDAAHLTQPSVDCQTETMAMAICDAGVEPADIGYINAHGTGTLLNDVSETHAIKRLLPMPYDVPVSSTKSMHGHLVGAAGAIEFLITVLALKYHAVPPTANLVLQDPECDLDYVPNIGRAHVAGMALSNSFAVGGTAASLLVKQWQ